MNEEMPKVATDRIRDLEARVTVVEKRTEPDGRWVALLKHATLYVGVVGGILAGTNYLVNLVSPYVAKPDIEVEFGGPMDLVWDGKSRHVSFTYALSISNRGGAADFVGPSRAYLEAIPPNAGEASSRLDFSTIDITDLERGSMSIPFGVNKGDIRNLRVTFSSSTTAESQRAVHAQGRHLLVLNLNFKASNPVKVPYCFLLGPDRMQRLDQDGALQVAETETGC